MKHIKIASLILLFISVITFGAYKIHEYATNDKTPPVITAPTDTITASVGITEQEILEGVFARDTVSGNVTDTLVIEKISSFTDENTRIVTYAAIDEKGNVGRLQRTLVYTDYKEPTFTLRQPLRIPAGKSVNLFTIIGANSVLDGDLSNKVKYTLGATVDLGKTGNYEIEFRVTDSSGTVEYLTTNLEVYDSTTERIKVTLTDYLIYLPIGAEFDANDYYKEASAEGTLSIADDVDTSKAGVYQVKYTVEGEKGKGITKLLVIVK